MRIRAQLALVVALGYLAFALVVTAAPSRADTDITYPLYSGQGGGKRIYLSAAYHTAAAGARGECPYQGVARAERGMARALVEKVANHDSSTWAYLYAGPSLVSQGYRVRFGRGDPSENTMRSNSWGSNMHIAFHSNAGGSGTCTSATGGSRGTRQMYRSGESTSLPNKLESSLDGWTPGTGDQICTITACSSYSCLIELCGIDAPAASYSETEFHDWDNGTAFLIGNRAKATGAFLFGIDDYYN